MTNVKMANPVKHLYICGRLTGGGGGADSDAKSEFFQFSPFFSKISFRRGEGYVITFEISKKRPFRKGMGHGGVGDHTFSPWAADLGRFGICL